MYMYLISSAVLSYLTCLSKIVIAGLRPVIPRYTDSLSVGFGGLILLELLNYY